MVSVSAEAAEDAQPTTPAPSCRHLLIGFLVLGATAFGGPATVAQMRNLTVVRRRWLLASQFDEGLALAQVLPGATAMQCAAHAGLRLRGFRGALMAFVGFALPAFLLMLVASVAYSHAIQFLAAQATLRGLNVAVIAVVAWSALGFARAQIGTFEDLLLVVLSALLLSFGCHPVLVVAATALVGMLRPGRTEPASSSSDGAQAPRSAVRQVGLLMLAACFTATSLFLISPRLALLGLTMTRIDLFAFGGGFAALPLMHDEFVRSSAVLSASTLMDGVALGQVTPGPIVITAAFVGYQVDGVLGAVVATAGIFFPSFTLVIAVAPWFGRLQSSPRFRSATKAAALAFVGLLVFVTFQFASSLLWTTGLALLALVSLAGLAAGVRTHWIVLACGLAATLMQRFGVS
jgi:chromate transporter